MKFKISLPYLIAATVFVAIFSLFFSLNVVAQKKPEANFSIQVSPAPIIATIKPGQAQKIDFQIRNNGNQNEKLKLEFKQFTVDQNTTQIQIQDQDASEVSAWIKIDQSEFNLAAGSLVNKQLEINPPQDVGFSYQFVLLISRAENLPSTSGNTQIKASVAVFTLLTVDKPGARRQFEVQQFSAKRRSFEFLPVEFDVQIKNNGNVSVQPYGNIFIQRQPDSQIPLAVLKLNSTAAVVLPEISRNLNVTWDDGFPVYKLNNSNRKLVWDWSKADKFRFGKYYAKLVAVYNDGQRDVPVESLISFWVIPLKLILAIIGIIIVLAAGIYSLAKRPLKLLNPRRYRHRRHEQTDK